MDMEEIVDPVLRRYSAEQAPWYLTQLETSM